MSPIQQSPSNVPITTFDSRKIRIATRAGKTFIDSSNQLTSPRPQT